MARCSREAVAAVAPAQSVETAAAPAPQAQASAEPATGAPAETTQAPAGTAAEKPTETASAPAAGEVPQATAPKLQPVNSAVIIRRGDSLWRISRRVYGQGVRYSTIYLANQDQIRDPDRIWPGQVFRVPETSKEGEPANLDAMGEQAMPAPKQ